MALLGAAHEPFFHGGRPFRIGEHAGTADFGAAQLVAHLVRVVIVTHHARQRRPGAQPAQQITYIRSAAQSLFAFVGA